MYYLIRVISFLDLTSLSLALCNLRLPPSNHPNLDIALLDIYISILEEYKSVKQVNRAVPPHLIKSIVKITPPLYLR